MGYREIIRCINSAYTLIPYTRHMKNYFRGLIEGPGRILGFCPSVFRPFFQHWHPWSIEKCQIHDFLGLHVCKIY